MTEFAKGKNNRVNVVIYNVSTKGVAPEGFNPLF